PLRVGRPLVVDHLPVADDGLLVGAVGVHAPQLAGADEGHALAVRGEAHSHFGLGRVGQLGGLELVGLDELGVVGVVALQQVQVLVAAAVGDEDHLRRVGGPGDAVVVGRVVGQAGGVAGAAHRQQEDVAVDHEGDVLLVLGEGELGDALGERLQRLGVDLVVGVDLDGELARRVALAGGGDVQVGAALVDDPLAVGADAGPADGVVLVEGHQLRRALAIEIKADDVGRGAGGLADVGGGAAVGAPHRRGVLAVEVGHLAVVGAVGVAHPDVVVGRAAVALAVPQAGAADVGDLIALGGEGTLLATGGGDALLAA